MKIGKAIGPTNSPVMLVGEAFGEKEEAAGIPFVGSSGHLLKTCLNEVGLPYESCRVTNVINARPPRNEIKQWFLNKTEGKKGKIELRWGRYPAAPIIEGLKLLEAEIRAV